MGSIFRRKHRKKGKVYFGNVVWIQYSRAGRKIRESSGSTKEAEARKLLNLREGMVAQGVPLTQKTNTAKMNELFQDVVNDWKINKRRSVDGLERRLKLHILPFFYGKRASIISTADIRHFILLRQEAGASNAEINRELAIIRRAFSLALQAGKLIHRPHVPMLKESNVRTGFLEREEFLALRAQLAEPLRELMTVAYVTGWRIQSELLPLQWRNVDFKAGRLTLNAGTTKNEAARTFPFTCELREALEAQKVKADALKEKGTICPWVFHRDGRRIKVFRKAWENACKRAGIPGRIPHDFRRTAVRNLVRAGVPERVAMQLTGHKTRSVFERYNIVSEGDLTMAAERIDAATPRMSQTLG